MSLTKVTFSMIQGMIANALDYGAHPTGVSDSAPAINAAIAAAKFVYLPAGTYRVDTPIDLKTYAQAGLIGELARVVRVIKAGELTKKVALKGLIATKGAKAAIEAAGGSVE